MEDSSSDVPLAKMIEFDDDDSSDVLLTTLL
jgi:hypothetical protein